MAIYETLSSFLTVKDVDFSNPLDLKIKEGMEVKDDNGDLNIDSDVLDWQRDFIVFPFREQMVDLKVILPDNYEEIKHKKSTRRNLTQDEQNNIERQISNIYAEELYDNYVERKISIDLVKNSNGKGRISL